MKRLIKVILVLTLVLVSMMNINCVGPSYAESIDADKYIVDIKIVDISGERAAKFFNGYELIDNKIILKITENAYFDAFRIPNRGYHLKYSKLIIETANIERIKVNNPAVRVAGGVEYRGVENLDKTAAEWEAGIPFVDMGFMHPTAGGQVVFDKDAPPIFTFVTDEGSEFMMTWEAIKVEEEPRLKLTVKPEAGTSVSCDPTVKAGFTDGENYKELKIGDRVSVTAYDGYKSFFSKWNISGMDDNKFKELFGEEITTRDIEFEITKEIFDIAKDNKLTIEAIYYNYTVIDTTETSQEQGEVVTKVLNRNIKAEDGFPLAYRSDDIEFRAVPKEDYAFDRWEFMPPGVVGENTLNPHVNLNKPIIKIKLPNMVVDAMDHKANYHLRVKAVFKEKPRAIERIYDFDDVEYIQGYDKYELPETVKVKYDDGQEGYEIVSWDKAIEDAVLGENIFTGTVSGTDQTVSLKVTIRKITGIKEEDKVQEVTVYVDSFGGYLVYRLPKTARVILDDNSERIVNIGKWEGNDVYLSDCFIYNKHGIYEAEGIIEGFDERIKFILNVKKESEKDKIMVEFNTNGGSAISSIEVEKGQRIAKPEDPVKAGFKFAGWYIDEELREEFDFNRPITENITLYAKWEKDISTDEPLKITSVELIKDGKTIATGVMKGQKITLKLPKGYDESIIDGQHFLKITGTEGAFLRQERGYDGPIEKWAAGIISNSIMAEQSEKFTIYRDNKSVEYIIEIIAEANEVLEYTVIFNTMGGSVIPPIKVKEGETVLIPKEPTKEGYKFVGWYKDVLYRYEYDFNTIIKDDMELFAKWEKSDNSPKLEEKQEPRITSFSLLGIPGAINHSKETINVYLPFYMDLEYLVPGIKYEGDEIYPDIGMPQNFNKTVYYTVSVKGYGSKTYKVYVDVPRERDRYDRRDRHIYYEPENWYRSLPRSSSGDKDSKDWYEISQEIKKKRLEEERPSLTSQKVRTIAFNEAGRITAQSGSAKRDLSIIQGNDHVEIKLIPMDQNDNIKNQINIPAEVLTNLNELGFDYLKYSTDFIKIKIFPFMDSADGLYLNIKPAPSEKNNDIQSIWAKTKGAGKVFQIETNSTKAGLSFEMKLDKDLPREYIRVVKYNYMKSKFEDISPHKWSVINGHVYVEQVSDGVYGIIYKK